MRRCRPVRLAVWLLALCVPAGLPGQIPGGKGEDTDLQAAQFRAAILGEVNPLVASWRDAWSGRGDRSIDSHYTDGAVLAVPGGMLVRGREGIAEFTRRARLGTGSLSASMLDFDAGDGLAYLYGSWEAQSVGGSATASGNHVTLIMKDGRRWLIRTQLFVTDTAGPGPMRVVMESEALAPLTAERIGSGSNAARQKAVFDQLVAALASFRSAWGAGDAPAVTALMRDDVMLQLPGRSASIGAVAASDLAEVLPTFRNLHTVELDFDRSGTMAFVVGRYYVDSRSGSPRSGNYIAVFKNSGSGWLIRSLVFA